MEEVNIRAPPSHLPSASIGDYPFIAVPCESIQILQNLSTPDRSNTPDFRGCQEKLLRYL
jgi:hypothetical protein